MACTVGIGQGKSQCVAREMATLHSGRLHTIHGLRAYPADQPTGLDYTNPHERNTSVLSKSFFTRRAPDRPT